MDQLNHILEIVSGHVWGLPLIALLLGTGLFLTLRLVFIQLRGFAHGVGIASGRYDSPEHEGQLTHFQALSAALSATIGIGNIGGVATAIYYGGPGAIFWMWVSAFFGMALKYTECTLAIRYRKIDPDGNVRGGPMYFIELGMSKYLRPLAYLFALCTAVAAFGTGNMVQSNTVAHAIVDAFEVPPDMVGAWRWVIGIAISSMVGIVIIGGIRRIGRVASYLVPFMSVLYVCSALIILMINLDQVIPAFRLIFHHAFNPVAVAGGSGATITVWMTIQWGLRRGLFSNESGQGSAPMAHATAKVEEPVREGMVAMLGPFIDTILICSMTALVIITTGLWDSGINGAPLTMAAFNEALPAYGRWMVVIAIFLFAYSTILSWSYYGEKGIEYLVGAAAKLPYKWVFLFFTLIGARLDLVAVWSFADIANGLMAVPNLVALIALSGAIAALTKKYMDEKSRGLHKPYRDTLRTGIQP
ncbi:MAG: sodium:alanine symporter family protein [candidate division Zixibacteria bacterium]|nr:sodium:alanine symporter family protein [candidate division Zixibacteria bacterium]